MAEAEQCWPELPLEAWEPTYKTLHLWTQIVGKIQLELTPRVNHWWNTALHVTSRGLTTRAMPYRGEAVAIEFDFCRHQLEIRTSFGAPRWLALRAQSVAAFYRELMGALAGLGMAVTINTRPQEMADPIAFDQDETHRSYEAAYAHRCWRILLSSAGVFEEFRARFEGKASPVQFFWGSFDLAVTRFSGRRAPPRQGVITSEAYSHECSSLGWWPGGGAVKSAAFYAYTAPAPAGLAAGRLLPPQAYFDATLGEFLLSYDTVRAAPSPRQVILEFAQSAYAAGADLAHWDRAGLERDTGG
ncbi:MAG: DUF5996 family protein [Terriglobales bacterium]